MPYEVVSLFAIAVLNALFSYFLLEGEKNKTNILFSLVTLSVALWSVNLALFIASSDLARGLFYANNYYLAAAAIPLLFFYFSLFFPPETTKRWKWKHTLYLLPFLLLILATLANRNIILAEISLDGRHKAVVLNQGFYLVYALYFLFFVTLSYYQLGKSYLESKNILEKIQLRFIVWGTLISYLLGMTFNLFLPFLGNYRQIWLGPVFTLIMVFSIGYAVFRHHLFNVKVITAEVLTFSIWFFILIRTLISDTLQDQIVNGVLLLATTISGIFLVRSVIKEVETREKIERLAEDLSKANARLKVLDQQKSEFVSIASHQLRGPLTAIKGYASMVVEGSFGPVDVKAKEAVRRIFESSLHLAKVVEDFLNVTKIEQGGMKFEFTKVDLKKLAVDTVAELKPNIERAGVAIAIGDNGEKEYYVLADFEKLRQVIANLIDNSVKYAPKGDVKIFIDKQKESGKITLSITDNGMGIPKELENRLFEKFSRGEGVSKINTGGSGLGLYLAKEVIEAHQGKIWAHSAGEGKGSTFFVELNEYEQVKEAEQADRFAKAL